MHAILKAKHITVAFLLLFVFVACKTRSMQKEPTIQNDYESSWKKVDSLERIQLYQSALKLSEQIRDQAVRENNAPQTVKAAIYINKYAVHLNDDGIEAAIAGMETAIAHSKEPVASILYSLTAELYAYYLQSRAWQLRSRTNLDTPPGDDIRSWNAADFVKKITNYYFRSLEWPALRTIPVADYEAILTGDSRTDSLRPVLYDILGHRAIDYFMQQYAYLTDPVYAFELTNIAFLGVAVDFARFKIPTDDEQSFKYKTLRVFQSLIAFHIRDAAPEALIDLDLKRLQWVYEQLQHEDKDAAYLRALTHLEERYPASQAAADIGYVKALYYQRRSAKYSGAPDDPYRDDLKTAKAICEQVIQKYPGSKGAAQCKNLLSNMTAPALSMQTEQVMTKGEFIPVSISFSNLRRVKLTVHRLSYDDRSKLTGRTEDIRRFLNGLPVIEEKRIALPESDDLRQHHTEVVMKPLDYGFYALMLSDEDAPNSGFDGYCLFHVSDLAYWFHSEPTLHELVVTDRRTGEPLQDVKAEYFAWEYDASSRRNVLRNLGSGITNVSGITVPAFRDNRSGIQVKLTRGTDVLFLDHTFSGYRYFSEDYERNTALLFTDRAIYRPGQTIHFKGYVIGFDRARMPSLKTQMKLRLALIDVNGQEVSTQEVSPNDYGTFSGTFTAPEGRLAGSMSIQCTGMASGHAAVQVEEYKRPTFEVTYEPALQPYKLDASVVVTGKAMTYAGVPIDNGTVQYRIVRRAYFPWFPWWRWGWQPNVPEMIIAQGVTTTDAEGAFTVMFTARGDKSISNQRPEYVFTVSADVTDVAGETRSATKEIILSKQSFRATVALGEHTDINLLTRIPVTAMNLNGEDVTLNVRAQVHALETPGRLLRKRYWQMPDMPLLSDTEYQAQLPAYALPQKENPASWIVKSLTGERNFNVRGADTIALDGLISAPGTYRFTFAFTAENGDTSSLIQYVHVIDPQQPLPPHLLISESLKSGSYEPGSILQHRIGTSNAQHVRYVTDRQSGISRQWLNIAGMREQTLEVAESDRGGLSLAGTYVYDNRIYSFQHNVQVPWSNKILQIEYLTYRDKTEPGAQEEWHLKISGEKKEAVSAEMLATMYDASLDAFLPHHWSMNLYPSHTSKSWIQQAGFGAGHLRIMRSPQYRYKEESTYYAYRAINWFNFPWYGYRGDIRMRHGGVEMREAMAPPMAQADTNEEIEAPKTQTEAPPPPEPLAEESAQPPVALRTNLDETVFFMPHIESDTEGNITLKFKMNEALTRWKFLALAHTKDLRYGLTSREIVTQKEIMVFPHMPRFLRQNDEIRLTAKVHNMTDAALQATAELLIIDATSGENVSRAFSHHVTTTQVQLPASGSAGVQWMVKVPDHWTAPVKYQVIARAGNKGDGEEGLLPVLTDRIFVTETMALHMPARSDNTFVFDAFKSANSTTLTHKAYTVEITSNPAWIAVQSLPYLQEYPHACAEQIWNRLYANLVARKIVTQFPEIGETYKRWTDDPTSVSLMSNLSKNQELKSALLEETPWVRDAMSEEEQMRNIAVLLDGERMSSETAKAILTLGQMQLSNGGFPWFAGGRDNRYVTQYLVEGAGHLTKMGAIEPKVYLELMRIVHGAIRYSDARLLEEYNELARRVREGKAKWEDDNLTHLAGHYLYARSFFMQQEMDTDVTTARKYYLGQAEKYWNTRPLYVQALLALSLQRWGQPTVVKTMRQSFEERALYSAELGRYWKQPMGYYWYELPIERQALMIELFEELGTDQRWIDELRLWLLKNKQTNRWTSTKATAAAVYALLMQEDNWLHGAQVVIRLGGAPIEFTSPEAGSGYVKHTWRTTEVKQTLGEIKTENPNNHVAWGGVYWQYFEDMDKVKPAEGTPLKMRKSLHKQVSTDAGLKLTDLADVQVGDKLISRIEIEVDRDMEFIHLKDMRASGLEPINVLSSYKWQGGLGYYESTGDLATHFFFDRLPRGKYVFEYPVRVAHAGSFSNGIATLQCMYAPEYSSHSGGLRTEFK